MYLLLLNTSLDNSHVVLLNKLFGSLCNYFTTVYESSPLYNITRLTPTLYACAQTSCTLTLLPFTTDTTRPIHPGEVNGHTYHFVTREEFELDILQERFLEHEEVKNHFYGTSVSAIKKIVESGRVPVLDLQPQVSTELSYHATTLLEHQYREAWWLVSSKCTTQQLLETNTKPREV